jgi:signal transduction histidine kinase
VLALRATACAAASITVVKDLAPKLPRVAGDALLLQQAILNIVMNAEQAIAYGVVQEHGAQLQAANRKNGGAIFTMALPAGFAEAVE